MNLFQLWCVVTPLDMQSTFPAPPLLSTPDIQQLADKTITNEKHDSHLLHYSRKKLFDIPVSDFRQTT